MHKKDYNLSQKASSCLFFFFFFFFFFFKMDLEVMVRKIPQMEKRGPWNKSDDLRELSHNKACTSLRQHRNQRTMKQTSSYKWKRKFT